MHSIVFSLPIAPNNSKSNPLIKMATSYRKGLTVIKKEAVVMKRSYLRTNREADSLSAITGFLRAVKPHRFERLLSNPLFNFIF